MPSPVRRRGLRNLLNWITKSPSKSPSRHIVVPHLRVMELEDRRVLSAMPTAYLSAARELVLSAGSRANDGQDDTFFVRREGGQLQVSVNGQDAFTGPVADVSSIRIEGSNDRDVLYVDYSAGDPLPLGGAVFNAGNGDSKGQDALVLLGSTLASPLERVTHQFVDLGSGRIRVDLADRGGQSASTLDYQGVETILDAGRSKHLVFQDDRAGESLTLTGGDSAGRPMRLASSAGSAVVFDAPIHSLTVAASAIDIQGTIRGERLDVELRAQDELHISGTIDVSDSTADHRGGAILASAERIDLADGARLDASGEAGGGVILIGGGFQGPDASLRNASNTHVAASASIRADALGAGNGGMVVVWADDRTVFEGQVLARGGANQGDGGFAEVSGKHRLEYRGVVDLSAPMGTAGTLLLDPATIVIDSDYAALLVAQLELGNVSLVADEILVQAAIDASGNSTVGTSLELHGSTITLQTGANITTKGGDLLLAGAVVLQSGAPLTLSTGSALGGNVSIIGPVDGGGADLTIEAGSGDITLAGTVDGVRDLALFSGGATYLKAAIGARSPLGSLNTDAGGMTYVGTTVTTEGGTQIYDDPVVLTSHATFTDTGTTGIFFNNTVDGDANGPWDLTVVTAKPLAEIQFHGAVGSGHWIRNVTLVNAGRLTIGPDADMTVEGTFAQVGLGSVRTAGDITTSGGGVSFASAVTIDGDVAIDTGAGAGDILFNNTLDGAGLENLTLLAGGNLGFAGSVGAFTPLGAITIRDAHDVTFQGSVAAASLVQLAGSGATTLRGHIATSAMEGVDLTAAEVVLDGVSITAAGDGSVRFQAAVDLLGDTTISADGGIRFDGTVDSSGGGQKSLTLWTPRDIFFGDALGSATAGALGKITVLHAENVEALSSIAAASLVQWVGMGTTTLAGDVTTSAAAGLDITAAAIVLYDLAITTTGGGIVRLNAPVDLNGDVSIDAEGAITFESTVGSPGLWGKNLTLVSGADIAFRDAVGGGPGDALGAITITTAANVRADSTITAASLAMAAVSGTATLTDDVTTSAVEGIDLTAGRVLLDGLKLTAAGNGIVRLNGPVVLDDDVAVEAIDGGIVFTAAATIDSRVGETNDLVLTAGRGSVSFNADIGAEQPIGSLVVTQADGGVTFGGESGPDAGPVALVRITGNINLGSVAPIADGILLNAGGGNTISFVTAGGNVRFNGLVELQSEAAVDTTDGGSAPGGDIRFTRYALIDSQSGKNNGLTLCAGLDGAVSFNADIGSVTGLRQLIVTSARGVAFGNDTSLADADLAPIAVTRVDGAPLDPTAFSIDIGSTAAIGEGGIQFNAGEAGTLVVTTTGDKVRLNGAVELGSHVLIDTSDGGSEPGAEIRFTRHATVDSHPGERNDLLLSAGSDGMVRFNADLGGAAALGRLIVAQAAGVAFGGDADPAEPDLAPLGEIRVIGHLDPLDADAFSVNIGSVGPIGGQGITFNAGNGNTLLLITTADKVRFNGPVQLQSHAVIDTSNGGASRGAEIRFTANAPIDSEATESNGLTLTAGVYGTVSFNADLGATAALGHLIVTEASGVALGSPLDLTDPDLAPVAAIWIDGDAPEPGGFALDIGSAAAIGSGGISLHGGDGGLISLFSTADKVRFHGAVRLQSDALIDTTGNGVAAEGAEILFEGTIDGAIGGLAENLSLVSHTAPIVIAGDVGAAAPLGTIALQDDLPDSTGAVFFHGAVYAQALETFGQPYDVELLGGGHIVDGVEFLNTGGVTLGDGAEDELAFGHGATSVASDTRLGGTIRTLDLDLQFAGVRVIADAKLLTAGGNIGFAGTVDSMAGEAFDLELTASSGEVQFGANVGGLDPLGQLVVHSAGRLELGSDAASVSVVKALAGIDLGRTSALGDILLNGGVGGTLAMSTAGGVVRLNGRVELQSDVSVNTADEGEPDGADIRFTSSATIDSESGEANRLLLAAGSDGAMSFNANLGATVALKQLIVARARSVAFGNDPAAGEADWGFVDTVRVDGDPFDPDAFAIHLGSAAAIDGEAISLNAGDGNTIQFLTTGDKVRFNGVVELRSHAWINTSDGGSPGAEIRFTLNAPIDSQLGESNGLTLTAGAAGIVTFNADIGTHEAPGHLIVTDAWGVVFGGEQLPDFAPLSLVRIGGDALSPGVFFLNLGSNTVIGDGGIVLNGGHDLAGEPLTLTIASASGAMRFNGPVSLWSDVLLDTADAEASFGAEIRFTQYAPINSQAGERNELTLTAGEGNLEFNANLGETHALGRLNVLRADAGVVFGASDEPEPAGDRAPVALVKAEGGIDLGSRDVITGGIVLNAGVVAGEMQVTTLATDGADVRVNGPLTLASHAAIDTANGDLLFTDECPIDSQPGEKNDLVLNAGTGRIVFNADLGAQQALRWLEAMRADGGVYFGGADVAQGDLGDLGPVRQVVVEVGGDLGSQAVISEGIVFNAGEWGELVLVVQTGDADPATSDARLNGPVWLRSDLAIDTSGGVAGIGITFTDSATIDSENGEHNSLRLDAGPGDVRFYADIGVALAGGPDSRIGRLDVTSSGNIWVSDSVLRIDAFGDVVFVSSGDVGIGYAPADGDYPGDPPPTPDVDPPTVETTVAGYTVTIRAAGNLTIVDGAALESHTGMVSNAPPLLRPDPDDPNKVLVPGDRVHEIKGRMGGSQTLDGGSLDNWERGVNFTLALYWSDNKSTILHNIQAGDTIFLEVGEDGEILRLDIVHSEEGPVGEIHFTLRRHYSLSYLQTVETTVETWLVLSNDPNVFLDDSRVVNLNETSTFRGIKVASDLMRPSEPIPEYLSPPPLRPLERAAVVVETPTVPVEARVVQYEESRPPTEERGEKLRVWYLVRVLPNGKEDVRHPLSEEIASDPVKLFQMLREMGLPDGKYRIYLEELGFPRRLVYEFYKSGNSLGDPVRERGPGANPVPEAKPQALPSMDPRKTSARPVLEPAAEFACWLGAPASSLVLATSAVEAGVPPGVLACGSKAGGACAGVEGGMAVAGEVATDEAPFGVVVALGAGLWGTRPTRGRHQEASAMDLLPARASAGIDRRDGSFRVDQALERCPRHALTLGARLQRRLRSRS